MKIGDAINATGRRVSIMDAATTILTLNLERGTHSVKVYALAYSAGNYPEISVLGRLDAVEKRLQRLRHRTVLGDNAEAMLAAANAELEQQYPGVGAFIVDSLTSAYKLADGAIKIDFDAEFDVVETGGAVDEDVSGASSRKFRINYQLAAENEEPVVVINEYNPAKGG